MKLFPSPQCHSYGKKAIDLTLFFLLFLSISFPFYAQSQLAFPSATGAGAYATGGRGKPVYIVSNLNNSGAGSFRQALEDTRDTDGGIIVFSVSGTIVLTTKLDFRNQGNITIAGQTAPEGGITIVGSNSNARLEFQNMDNFIIRYIRFRPNYPEYPQTEQDALYLYNCSNYIIDHCSISWGTDENADAGNGTNYTWQRNLFSESNKTGMIMGAEVEDSYNMSFVNNAFYNCSHRFPNWQTNGRIDVINNVIWGYRGLMSSPLGTFEVNHIGNYYRYFRDTPVAETYKRMMYYYYPYQGNNMPSIYTSGNYVSGVLTNPDADNWLLWRWRFNPSGSIYDGAGNDSPMPTDLQRSTPFDLLGEPFEIKSYTEAFENVINDVGSNARLDEYGNKIVEIDDIDSIYLDNMQNQIVVDWTQDDVFDTEHRSEFINSISSLPINAHHEDFDTNNDGIPDQWILSRGFDVNQDLTTYVWPSGYVGIEEYLNEVDHQETNNTSENQVVITSSVDNNTICLGEEVTLTASEGISYTWQPGNISESSFIVSPEQTTTYYVEALHQDGSISTASIVIVVNPKPEVNAGEDITISAGESITLSASGAQNYIWNTGQTTPSISVSPQETTTYEVVGIANNCESSDTVTVYVNSVEVIAYAGEDIEICQGFETTLTASGGDSYLWSTGETTASITVNPSVTTIYTVVAYLGNQQDEDEVKVTVNPNPNVVINNNQEVIISQGEYVTLSASGANEFVWSNGVTQPHISVNPNVTTTYSVIGYVGDCMDEESITVSVIEHDVAQIFSDTDVVCYGQSVTLTASEGNEYLWSNGETTPSITVIPEESTEYWVEVSNGTNTSQATMYIEVQDCLFLEGTPEEQEFDFLIFQDISENVIKVKITGFNMVDVKNMAIYDISGRFIFEYHFEDDQESTVIKEINSLGLSKGIYIVKLIYNNSILTKKIPIR